MDQHHVNKRILSVGIVDENIIHRNTVLTQFHHMKFAVLEQKSLLLVLTEQHGFALFQYDIQEVKKIILDEKFLEVSNNVSRLFVIRLKQSLLLHHEQILCVIIFYQLFRVVFTFSPPQSHDIFFLLNDFEAVREDFQVYFFSKQSAHNHSYHDQFDEPMKV